MITGEKRGESHGKQGIQIHIQPRTKKFCWRFGCVRFIYNQMLSNKIIQRN
ncbi:MAG: helix-turn-helix domain-containing protein [Allobaculum sp.]|nr:helix-turn-helix domain-containing protein [Allobaculum sp.]